jgi:hypothetical protein
MECTTIDKVIENGVTLTKPKKQFETLELAIAVAKIENAKDEHDLKVVAYKCNTCHKFHIGRNGKPLTEKERAKRKMELDTEVRKKEYQKSHPYSRLKVVGYVDLDKIRY